VCLSDVVIIFMAQVRFTKRRLGFSPLVERFYAPVLDKLGGLFGEACLVVPKNLTLTI
jgi:hypothetical protein